MRVSEYFPSKKKGKFKTGKEMHVPIFPIAYKFRDVCTQMRPAEHMIMGSFPCVITG
jgi:hypothetical protein